MNWRTALVAMVMVFLAGVGIGALGYAKYFVAPPSTPTAADPVVVYEKLKEVGELLFAEVPERSEVQVEIPRQFRLFGKVVASDGAKVAAKWTGVHVFAVNLKEEAENLSVGGRSKIKVENLPDRLRITVPPYQHRLSFLDPGSLDFHTVNGSWFIDDDRRYGVALRVVQTQNMASGDAYLRGEEGRAKLKRACITAVTGIVLPLVGSTRPLEVVCPDPG